jgi:hypothetical protein
MTSHTTKTNPTLRASKVALASKRNKCQLLLEFNAGYLPGHGVLACIDLQFENTLDITEIFKSDCYL